MEHLIVSPENEKQLSLLKALLQEMKIKFRTEKSNKEEFYLTLDEKIKAARKEKLKGELVTINPHHLWESI